MLLLDLLVEVVGKKIQRSRADAIDLAAPNCFAE